jgi:Uma2 family endonuclease
MAEPARPIIRDTDAFIAWEQDQDERYEFVGGAIRLMAGGSANHDLLSANAIGLLRQALSGSGCRVHGSNLKVRSPANAVMYPDCFVRCGPHRGAETVVDDPVLVVEVLSPSTERGDLTRKRWAYQAIPGLEALLFIDPDEPRVELARRDADGTWRSSVAQGLDAVLDLPVHGIRLPLAELYEGAELGPSTA